MIPRGAKSDAQRELRSKCVSGKRRYRSLEAAEKALHTAEVMRELGNTAHRERRAYECPDCDGAHLTSKEYRMPVRSAKTAKVYRTQRIPLVTELLEQFPYCQISWDDNCTIVSTEVDERCGRGRGGSILDRENCQTTCHACHQMKTANPAEAEARGLAVSSADYRKDIA